MKSNNTRPVRIFISYSHQDTTHKEKLWKQLHRFMGGKGELWHDLKIGAGQEWKQEIWVALHQADMILFLMSDDAIHSGFIWEVELKKTFERYEKNEVIFIPIYLRNCKWQEIPDLQRFQVIPRDNKPMIDTKIWGNPDEPFQLVAGEIIEIVKTKWQELNNVIIEQNRPKRFAGISQFLKDNLQFFDMGKIARPSTSNRPEDFLYFVGIANQLKDFSEIIRTADANGTNWAEETLENIESFREICESMETVWRCSDYVWSKVSSLHQKVLEKVEVLEDNIGKYIGADWSKMDIYKTKYALPLSFTLDEYQQILKELADESLTAQSR